MMDRRFHGARILLATGVLAALHSLGATDEQLSECCELVPEEPSPDPATPGDGLGGQGGAPDAGDGSSETEPPV